MSKFVALPSFEEAGALVRFQVCIMKCCQALKCVTPTIINKL